MFPENNKKEVTKQTTFFKICLRSKKKRTNKQNIKSKNKETSMIWKTTKKGCSRDSRNRIQKGYFAVLTRTCRAACYLHHPGAVPRVTGVIFWISIVPTSAGRAACTCALSFRDSPRHSCCGLIASFPGPCASSGGRLPEALFMVFLSDSKGAKVCKSKDA